MLGYWCSPPRKYVKSEPLALPGRAWGVGASEHLSVCVGARAPTSNGEKLDWFGFFREMNRLAVGILEGLHQGL